MHGLRVSGAIFTAVVSDARLCVFGPCAVVGGGGFVEELFVGGMALGFQQCPGLDRKRQGTILHGSYTTPQKDVGFRLLFSTKTAEGG